MLHGAPIGTAAPFLSSPGALWLARCRRGHNPLWPVALTPGGRLAPGHARRAQARWVPFSQDGCQHERAAEEMTVWRVAVNGRRSTSGRVGRAIAIAAVLLVITGCDPAPPPTDPVGANLDIEVEPSGRVRTRLAFAEELDVDLGQIEDEVSPSVVRGTTADGERDRYYSVVNGIARRGYEPGQHPTVTIQVPRQVLDALYEQGVRHLDVRLCVPEVDYELSASLAAEHRARRCDAWTMTTSGEALTASVVLSPSAVPWVRSVALTAVTILSATFGALALRRRPQTLRERTGAAATALPGAIAFAIGCATLAAAPHGDALGVTGTLSGTPLAVATNAPVALLFFGFASLVMVPAAFLAYRKPNRPATA